MNIFDYLIRRAENKREVKESEKLDKLELEIGELAGEIEGLKDKVRVYETADRHLVFSNFKERGDICVVLGTKIGRLEILRSKRDQLLKTQTLPN